MKLNYEKEYKWRWRSTIIDFSRLPKNKEYPSCWHTKMDEVFRHLPLPDDEFHFWKNGDYSSEYNHALQYAIDYNLTEIFEYDEEKGEYILVL